MVSLGSPARRPLIVVLIVGAVLALTLARPDARADPGPSTTPDATWGTNPAANGGAARVMAIAVADRRVFLGGDFTVMVPPGADGAAAAQPRGHLAALDVDRHTLLPWDPDADGAVHALAVSTDGTQLYVGGDFDHIGGLPVAKLARVDLATGAVDRSFDPGIRGDVRALALAGDRLYVGGTFDAVAGPAGDEPRPKLAALDAATGALLPWLAPPLGPGRYVGHDGTPTPADPSGDVLAIAVPPDDGSRVWVAGTFLDFAGQAGLLVLDAGTGQPRPEQWRTGRPVFDLAVSPADGQTVFASAGGPGGRVYAFSPTEPGRPLWSTAVDGDAPGVAASDSTVYLMGHYDYAGPQSAVRHHLAAFAAGDGGVEDWNPTANTPWGAFSAAVGAGHVFVGGEFTRINGQPQPGFAEFALPPAPATTTTSTSATTTTTSATTTTTSATTTTTR